MNHRRLFIFLPTDERTLVVAQEELISLVFRIKIKNSKILFWEFPPFVKTLATVTLKSRLPQITLKLFFFFPHFALEMVLLKVSKS